MPENPYEAPPEDSTADVPLKIPHRVSLPGGFLTVTLIGVVTGLGLAYLLAHPRAGVFPFLDKPFLAIGVLMFAACSVCVYLLRGLAMSLAKRLGLTVILTVVSYLLFVPVCTASSLGAMSLGMSQTHGPHELGLNWAVLFSCVLVLNLVMAVAITRLN